MSPRETTHSAVIFRFLHIKQRRSTAAPLRQARRYLLWRSHKSADPQRPNNAQATSKAAHGDHSQGSRGQQGPPDRMLHASAGRPINPMRSLRTCTDIQGAGCSRKDVQGQDKLKVLASPTEEPRCCAKKRLSMKASEGNQQEQKPECGCLIHPYYFLYHVVLHRYDA